MKKLKIPRARSAIAYPYLHTRLSGFQASKAIILVHLALKVLGLCKVLILIM